MPSCPHCNATISSEAQAVRTHCKCGAPMAGKIPPRPVVPGPVEATREVLPKPVGHARRRRGY
jgi:hypothetical protein